MCYFRPAYQRLDNDVTPSRIEVSVMHDVYCMQPVFGRTHSIRQPNLSWERWLLVQQTWQMDNPQPPIFARRILGASSKWTLVACKSMLHNGGEQFSFYQSCAQS